MEEEKKLKELLRAEQFDFVDTSDAKGDDYPFIAVSFRSSSKSIYKTHKNFREKFAEINK